MAENNIVYIYSKGKNKHGTPRDAKGYYDIDKKELTILKGSLWCTDITKDDAKTAEDVYNARTEIANEGYVNENGVFVKDYKFKLKKGSSTKSKDEDSTPISRSAKIICGASRGVDDCWKVTDKTWAISKNDRYLGAYINDLKKNNSKSPESNDTANANDAETASNYNTNKTPTVNEVISNELNNRGYLRQNVIFYGVPGCGKSHKINTLLHLDEKDENKRMPQQYYKRILFHPEYSYSDFVGQTMPVTKRDEDGKPYIEYEFVPGPFTQILKDALTDAGNYFLIIEEINRGNAPAIFGDLFQLLDRKDGKSEYSIDNKNIIEYLKKSDSDKNDGINVKAVYIPKNLTIFATMNTCDQNVFTLDTAFKRRWRMRRIKNDFKDSKFTDTDLAKAVIGKPNNNHDSTQEEFAISKKGITWAKFGEAINSEILQRCNDGTAAEDKLLGTHFVKEDEVEDAERFAEKVLMYLWNDVTKYDKAQLFNSGAYGTLDRVIEGFVKGENVFSPNCTRIAALYPTETNQSTGEENPAEESGTTE